MSALSGEQRLNQFSANVAQESTVRQTRGETALDPNAHATRERWNAAQVSNHESLFSFCDNLTTLMFTVASDLSEAQKNRLTSSISLQGMNVRAYTFESCKNSVRGIVLYAEKLDGKHVIPLEPSRQQHEQNIDRRSLR